MAQTTTVKIDEFRWIIPPTGGMRVPGIIYADERMMKSIEKDESILSYLLRESMAGINLVVYSGFSLF